MQVSFHHYRRASAAASTAASHMQKVKITWVRIHPLIATALFNVSTWVSNIHATPVSKCESARSASLTSRSQRWCHGGGNGRSNFHYSSPSASISTSSRPPSQGPVSTSESAAHPSIDKSGVHNVGSTTINTVDNEQHEFGVVG